MRLLQHRQGTQVVAQPAESEGKFFECSIFSAIFRMSLTSRESVGGRLPVDGGVAVVLGGPGQENTLAISCLSNDRCDI